MTPPRMILPGTVYTVKRRIHKRRFYLVPRPGLRNDFGYCLAKAAKFHGIVVHAYMVMSNHYHLLITDLFGNLPAFMQTLNNLLSRVFKAHWGLGKEDRFWADERYFATELTDDEAVLDAVAYALANPVRAKLVARATRWEGPTSFGQKYGTPVRFLRPSYCSKDMPESVELVLAAPRRPRGVGSKSRERKSKSHRGSNRERGS